MRTHGIFLQEDFWFLRIDEKDRQELFRANHFRLVSEDGSDLKVAVRRDTIRH